MYLAPLQQAKCADRRQITCGPDPRDWIAPSLPAGWHLLSFHFFVDWSQTPPAVAERIWMTRQLRLNNGDTLAGINNNDLLQLFCNGVNGRQEFADLERACTPCGLKVSAILLPEIPVTDINGDTPVWVIVRGQSDLEIHKIKLRLFKENIQSHSGGPVYVGNKGLCYGTSAIECYLSGTDAAFPGDADAVIVNDQDRIRGIIEYKKHTLDDLIGEHLVTRYYPYPDGRKYQRLNALAEYYSVILSTPVPLVILYFSTKTPVIRLQEIGALYSTSINIKRDSYDIDINDRNLKSISNEVTGWLGINR